MRTISRIVLVLSILTTSAPTFAEQILYQYTTWSVNDSKFGPIAKFQTRVKQALNDCDSNQKLSIDGAFGPGTKNSIIALTQCPSVHELLPSTSPARQGAITNSLWKLLLPDESVPDVTKRAAALKLTFEATDYDQMQWNFCQNKPFYRPSVGQDVCYSNDRASYITWGPHGATAGHGMEVQGILRLFLNKGDTARVTVFDQAFGDESKAVKRMLDLPKKASGTQNGPLETYLCSVWLDSTRRDAWRAGFKKLGALEVTHEIYRSLYSSSNFDGGKVSMFYKAWTDPRFGLKVTEIDHGFFIDRSAHMGISQDKLIDSLKVLKQGYTGEWPPAPAYVRQHISKTVIPRNRQEDRLGRDVAYYIQAIPVSELSSKEEQAWIARGKRNAVDVGLSDERFANDYKPTDSITFEQPSGQLASNETCPTAVLSPKKP